MSIYLVRHAIAVGRSGWDGDDFQRPLTGRGQRQAEALVDQLVGAEVRRIRSSPALRCVATVAPLASKLGLEVRNAAELAEGFSAAAAVALAGNLAQKRGDSVLCTHGDLVPEILRRLRDGGCELLDELAFAKGSTWRIEWADGRFTTATYRPPPA